ncbi:2-oxoacid:acceptor oxidoreductase family protein, partial [Ferroplasma sp. Type II]|uniref:2-oxoacid:acceptor oxidoreductase family protein n=1 Tax=Ferroplasma sp. Type II TaxID=261388 RepID=UPI0025BE7F03
MVALDPDTLFEHMFDVSKGAKVVYDSAFNGFSLKNARMITSDTSGRIEDELLSMNLTLDIQGVLEYFKKTGIDVIAIPFDKLINENVHNGPANRYYNTLGAGVTLALLGLDEDHADEGIKFAFKKKPAVIESNIQVIKAAYDYVAGSSIKTETLPTYPATARMLLTGNDATAIGKLMGGLRFQTYYPITPASDESTLLESHEEMKFLESAGKDLKKAGLVVVQCEDELSAINMANGAALTGTRSATATSGPGFSL